MRDLWPYLVSAVVVGVVSPLATIACIMLLASRRPLVNALAYLSGWTLVLVLLAVLGLSLLDPGRTPQAGGAGVKGTLDLMVGMVLLAMGVRTLVGAHALKPALQNATTGAPPPPSGPDTQPKWLTSLDTMRPGMAMVLGMAMVAINLPNLAVFLTALQSIATADLSAGGRLTTTVLLLVCINLALLIPIGIYALLPRRSSALLGPARRWLLAHDRAATTAVSLAFGAIFLLKGVTTLL